jgi:hypothetical protein
MDPAFRQSSRVPYIKEDRDLVDLFGKAFIWKIPVYRFYIESSQAKSEHGEGKEFRRNADKM